MLYLATYAILGAAMLALSQEDSKMRPHTKAFIKNFVLKLLRKLTTVSVLDFKLIFDHTYVIKIISMNS